MMLEKSLQSDFMLNYIRYDVDFTLSWVKVFRIVPEFRILRLTSTESQPQNAELRRP